MNMIEILHEKKNRSQAEQRIYGVAVGVVVDNQDPDNLGKKRRVSRKLRETCVQRLRYVGARRSGKRGRARDRTRTPLLAGIGGDEFDEVRQLSESHKGPLLYFKFFIYTGILVVLSSFIVPWSFWLSLAFAAVMLYFHFPSIDKLLLAAYYALFPKTEEGGLPLFHTVFAAAEEKSIDYISTLLEIGAKQLSPAYVLYEKGRARKILFRSIYSHLLSALLAVSLFAFFFYLVNLPESGNSAYRVLLLPCLLFPLLHFVLKSYVNHIVSTTLAVAVSVYALLDGPVKLSELEPVEIANLERLFLYLALLTIWLWIVLAIERKLRMQRLKFTQVEVDRTAEKILDAIEAENFGEEKAPKFYGVYLRAFKTTDKLKLRGIDLETTITYSLAQYLPILALGHPGEHAGAGRIQTSDAHWQKEILSLIERATIILIVPSHREGTLWEIDNLKQGSYFSKTIFIMPPELRFEGKPYSQEWAKAVKAAEPFGVELPEHFDRGLLFKLDDNGQVQNHAPFRIERFFLDFPPIPIDEQSEQGEHFDDDDENDNDDIDDRDTLEAAVDSANSWSIRSLWADGDGDSDNDSDNDSGSDGDGE